MFTPHHYTDRGRYGRVFNEDGTLWCVWTMDIEDRMWVYNDPFLQPYPLKPSELHITKVWLIGRKLRSMIRLS